MLRIRSESAFSKDGNVPARLAACGVVSGIPGGIFSPSLAVGAGLGANVAHLFPTVPVHLLGDCKRASSTSIPR
jgi:chloride channel protein, CIC family